MDNKNVLLNSIKYINQKEYWVRKLNAEMEETRFFAKQNQEVIEETKTVSIDFSSKLNEDILRVGKNSDVSIYIILVAALKTLLYKYTGNSNISVISPVYKENIKEDLLNDYLVIHDQFDSNVTFKELILKIRESVLNGFDHQDYPFEKLAEIFFDTPQKYNESSFSKVICVYENIHQTSFSEELRDNMIFKFTKVEQILEGQIQFNPHFYDSDYVWQIGRHLSRVMECAITDPSILLSKIPVLSEQEKDHLLIDLNQTKSDYLLDTPIPKLIEEKAKNVGDLPAVVFQDEMINYSELNGKANHLAKVLRAKGVTKGTYVPVLMQRSFELPIALLAIMKAGGVFVPLEITWPLQRLKEVILDMGAHIILTSNFLGKEIDFSLWENCTFICVDKHTLDATEENLDIAINLEDEIYVIYTSGSTGQPKGAINKHVGILNRFLYMNKRYKCTDKDVILLTSNHVFDAAVWQIFWPLINGVRTVIPQHSNSFDLENIINLIEREKVTITDFVPSVFNVLVDLVESRPELFDQLQTLRQLLIGGEAMSADKIFRFKSYFPNVSITNTYGPSETSIGTVFYEIPQEYVNPIPIGRPIDNVYTLILDEDYNPVPIGVAGELYLGGICVGSGYVNDLEKTRKVFIQPPITGFDYGIFYKTGDRVRYLADGNIEFMGRIDSQVKIRGIRIELGEIESQLMKHERIKKAVVTVKGNKSSEKQLCAYLVPTEKDHGSIVISEIREFLSVILPEYMIPRYFMEIKEIPLTSNGKLNYKALPEPIEDEVTENADKFPPRNIVEEQLAETWSGVLGKKDISMNDNFFMIGGDSIKTIQIVSRLKKLGYEADIADIFNHPTIAELALVVKKSEKVSDQGVVMGEVPLTPIQKDFFATIGEKLNHFNQAVMFYSKETLDEHVIQTVFSRIQEHHDALRMMYQVIDGEIKQINKGVEYPLGVEIHDLRGLKDQVQLLESQADVMQASFDISKGPLMKIGLFHLDGGDRLLLIIHHLVVDGISWRIIFEDINTLLEQSVNGQELSLPLKTDSYKVWAEKLNEFANSDQQLEELDYWEEIDSRVVPQINRDLPGINIAQYAQSVTFCLDEEETESLLTKVNETFNTTINDILLTALAMAVRKSFNNEIVSVAMEGHGREQIIQGIDLSRTVGWFTTWYPVVLDTTFNNDLARQIKEVKESLRRIPNKGIGYGVLKYLTTVEEKRSFQLNPQIIFNYLGQFDTDIEQTPFQLARENYGRLMDGGIRKSYDFDITGAIVEQKMNIAMTYSSEQYTSGTVHNFSQHFQSSLKEIIQFCLTHDGKEITPSDLGFKELTIEDLESFFD